MSTEKLLKDGQLKKHRTSKEEVAALLRVAKRDIADSKVIGVSTDRRFATAYNAILQLSAIILACRGYRAAGWAHHYTTFETLYEILGQTYEDRIAYFDQCRTKRNVADYSRVGEVTEHEVAELISEAESFMKVTIGWLKQNYPQYLSA